MFAGFHKKGDVVVYLLHLDIHILKSAIQSFKVGLARHTRQSPCTVLLYEMSRMKTKKLTTFILYQPWPYFNQQ